MFQYQNIEDTLFLKEDLFQSFVDDNDINLEIHCSLFPINC